MPLIVETGSGVANADSFASVEAADSFWGGRPSGQAWLSLGTSAKEANLREATLYIAARLNDRDPLNPAQGLPYPWSDRPTAWQMRVLVQATAMVADVARLGPLVGGAAQRGRVLSESKGLGPLSKSVRYSDLPAPSSANGRDLSFLDDMLRPIVGSGGGGFVIGTRARG